MLLNNEFSEAFKDGWNKVAEKVLTDQYLLFKV